MKIIFCSDPLYPNQPDRSFAPEVEAATAAGLRHELIDFEKLTEGDTVAAVQRIREREEPETAIYRGWMLRPEAYTRLYHELHERGVHLVNSPANYQHCHYLPESYDLIAARTPFTVWVPLPDCLDTGCVLQVMGRGLLHPFCLRFGKR
jgi:hypothetical protein